MTLTESKRIDAPTTFLVEAWPWDENGEPCNSTYAEMFWLPIIGPTGLWAFRRLNAYLDGAAGQVRQISVLPFGQELGLLKGKEGPLGTHNPVHRTLDRLGLFDLIRRNPENGVLLVRSLVPRLGSTRLQRLPEHLQALHTIWRSA